MSVLVIGATFVDYKGYSKNKYIPAGRNEGSIEVKHGGVVRNVSENLAKLQLTPTLISLVSTDGTSDLVVSHLNKVGVDTSLIRHVENGMGCWLAVFDESNDVVSSISSRPNLLPLVDIIKENEKSFENADAIIIEMDIDIEVVDLVFQYALKYHKKVYGIISNMSLAKERIDYISKTECFVCNEQEAAMLFNDHLENLNPQAIINKCIDKMISKCHVITLGEKGAIYLSNTESGYIEADKVNVLDTTGAGDGFFSGVVSKLITGHSLKEACIKGKEVASIVISRKENVI